MKPCTKHSSPRWIAFAGLHNVSYARHGSGTSGAPVLRFLPRKAFLILGFLMLWASGPSVAQTPSRSGPGTDPQVLWGYLPNGMGYAIIENHAAPMVGSVAVVHAGSGAEDWSTQGASHFLEHLLFNGTERRTQEEIYDEIDLLGAYNNATTRSTHVAYMLLAPRENFWKALDVQQDMIFHSTLPPTMVEKERGIILEELGHSLDDQSYEVERVLDLDLFGPEGYGMPTLGSETSIRTLTREQISRFYKSFYRPNRITWILQGDLDPRAALDSLRVRVGGIPAGESASVGSPPDRRPSPGAPLLRLHQLEMDGAIVQWSWITEDPSLPDFNAFRARFETLCEGSESPLGRACLSRWSGQIEGYDAGLSEYPGFSVATVRIALSSAGAVSEVLEAFPGLLEAVRGAPADVARILAWKVSRETEELYLREKPHYYGIIRGDLVAARGLPGLVGYLPAVTALAESDVARTESPLPWPPDRISVLTPVPDGSAAAGAETASVQERWALPNGAEVYALSGPDSPVLAVHLFVRDRAAREPQGRAGVAELLHSLLGTATRDRSAQDMSLALQSIGAELKTADSPEIPYDDFYTSSEFSFVRLNTLDRYAGQAFPLLAEILSHPVFPESDFEQAKSAALRRVARTEGSSRATAQRRLETWLRPGSDGAGVYGTSATLSPITLDEVRSFAGSYLDPRSFLFVIASSLPVDELRTLTEGTLGTMPVPSAPPPSRPLSEATGSTAAKPDGRELLARIRALRAEGAQERDWETCLPLSATQRTSLRADSMALLCDPVDSGQSYISLVRIIQASDSLRPVLTLANAVLSDQMAQQLREREGLAYSIGSSLIEQSPGTWVWVASAGTSGANLPRMLEGFQEAPAKLLRTPVDSLSVGKTAAKIYGRGLMRRATRINWAYYAGMSILQGQDPLGMEERQRALAAVNDAQVADVVRRFWNGGPELVILAR